MKHSKTKQSMAFVVAALLACQPISAYAATFADMNQVPWSGAEVSINKAASLGLVVGETVNGKTYFRPRDSVSLTESCQLAYKLLLQTGKATANASVTEKWAAVLKTYGIKEWAHPAVSYCLEEGIISISNLGSFMKNGSNLPATREQAVTILGRALTTGVPSYSANATTTKFNDNASISSEARPYVALLNQVGVVNGDNVGKFNPKSTLNRTETAVLVTNLYNVLNKSSATTPTNPAASTKSGTVKDMNALYVNFENSNAYYLFASTGATVTLNGASSSAAELVKLFKNGTTIKATLTLDSNTRITKLVATADTKTAEEDLTGTIKSLSKSSIKIGSNTYKIDDSSSVSVKIDGSTKKFSDLKEMYDDGETITATLTLDKDDYVTKIVATTKSSSSSKTDELKEIKKVSGEDYEAYIKVGSTKYYIEDIDDLKVTIDGKTKDFSDLKDAFGDLEDGEYFAVSVTLDRDSDEDNYITKITATKKASTSTKKGEITDLREKTGSKGTIELDDKNTYSIKDIDEVTVKIDSKTKDFDDLMDLFEDDVEMTATLTITGDYVTKIVVTTESDGTTKSGTLKDVDYASSSKSYEAYVKIGTKTYEIDDVDWLDVIIDDRTKDFDKLIDVFNDLDDDEYLQVKITLDDDDYVTKIVATTKYE
ncbi:MAG: S-layer homology domain-containing protein [Bacteroidales bacterium]|nr:S-layer homology domain-containing protein [Anaerotignum sp.]MCI5680213.1 S-layer homology domain-containing protein [Bacteroidales bacterium]MDY3926505.1 S-layer homology domain-containing protein [Anaerotignum sp.]